MGELALLGSELIRQRQYGVSPGPAPLIADVVGADGGPLLHDGDEAAQLTFDATCRALHRFVAKTSSTAAAPRLRRDDRRGPSR